MTRINVIPPKLLTNEHLAIALREGLRPINEVKAGKTKALPMGSAYRLNDGHVLWCRRHLLYVNNYFEGCKAEYKRRGFKGYDYSADLSDIPPHLLNDYKPTVKDIRTNLCRLANKLRFAKRPYHMAGMTLDSRAKIIVYIKFVLRNS